MINGRGGQLDKKARLEFAPDVFLGVFLFLLFTYCHYGNSCSSETPAFFFSVPDPRAPAMSTLKSWGALTGGTFSFYNSSRIAAILVTRHLAPLFDSSPRAPTIPHLKSSYVVSRGRHRVTSTGNKRIYMKKRNAANSKRNYQK